ncbi:DUF4912 domain-containing protein [Bacillus sp. UMB0893]|uniref:DUF4912 domain-containing protein n=1 Tax=Bacillus sp. UMB0893 TaxID=2066053 RepID=UPI000C77F2DA|nr:DUF4912 domain-containing protein [Bacillus sp. UMB0893]PLR68138.1 hypothetical protein CYJ36_08470 [Bacillus sp. UMB0893]
MVHHQSENLNTIRSQKPAYGDAMTLLIKNKSTLFLQWNISAQTKKSLSIICNVPFSTLYKTIRLYHKESNSVLFKDINITDNDPFLFIEETEGRGIYYAEFIVFQSGMHRLTILKSNEIKMKGIYMNDLKWVTLDPEESVWKRQFSAYSAYE